MNNKSFGSKSHEKNDPETKDQTESYQSHFPTEE